MVELKGHEMVNVGQNQMNNYNTRKKCKNNNNNHNTYVKSAKNAADSGYICVIDFYLIANLSIPEKPFACKKCTSQFTTAHKLSKHISKHKKFQNFLICIHRKNHYITVNDSHALSVVMNLKKI